MPPPSVAVHCRKTPGKEPKFDIVVDRSIANNTTRKKYASLWFHRVRVSMRKAGFPDADCKVEGRKAHAYALNAWDKVIAVKKKPAGHLASE